MRHQDHLSDDKSQETPDTATSSVSRREFAREALLRVGWVVPLSIALQTGADAGEVGADTMGHHVDVHHDRKHADGHTDTHSDFKGPPHIDKHYDTHFDGKYLDQHGDHNDA